MADFRPFRGLRYNLNKIQNLSSVIAPPYDVISPVEQREYHARSDYNVIRLELGLDEADDTSECNKYTRAAAAFADWQRNDILLPEPQPALYIYEQEFEFRGQRKVRRGIIGALKLEEWAAGVVLPHEHVLDRDLADRYQLMCACHANFSPVYGLYEDQSGSIAAMVSRWVESTPLFEVQSDDGDRHRLWAVGQGEQVRALHQSLLHTRIFIADGHHRYQTALRYRDAMRQELQKKHPSLTGDEACNFVMMLLVDLEDPGLVVLPTHRLVKSTNFDPAAMEQELAKYFKIEHKWRLSDNEDNKIEPLLAELARTSGSKKVFGVYGLRPETLSVLTLSENVDLDDLLPSGHSSAWRELDLVTLHALVIDRILGIKNVSAGHGQSISFVRDERQAVKKVRDGSFSLAFFINPPTVAQIRAVAQAGDKMPQKSTYFHPKPVTGLVINSLQGNVERP